jgi:hypothetical protein
MVLLLFFAITTISCKKVIKIEQTDLKTAKKDAKRFYNTYPDSVGCDLNGRNCEYAVSSVYTVYAVKFTRDHSKGLELEEAYPDYDFKEIIENFPKEADGVRIYEAIGDSAFLNYVVYTKPNNSSKPSNDILEKVYLIKNHKFDLRMFTNGREKKQGSIDFLHSHLSCAPNCPESSLLTEK